MSSVTIGASSDFFATDGNPRFTEFDLSVFRDDPEIDFRVLELGDEAPADALVDLDVLVILRPRITEASLARARRLALVARFGVGFDRVDVAGCSRSAIAVSNTPDAVRRPVAVAELTLLLALSTQLLHKDRLARAGPPG